MLTLRRSGALIATCMTTLMISFFYRSTPTVTHQCHNEIRNVGTTKSVMQPTKTSSITTPYSWDEAAMRFQKRKEYLRKTCQEKKMFISYSNRNENFLVDIQHKLLVCAVPKSGTTTWHRTVWALRRIRDGLDADQKLYTSKDTNENQQMVGKLSSEQLYSLTRHIKGDSNLMQNHPLNSSYRVILVRHPFARLISGWNQKFMLKSNYWVYLFKTYQTLLDHKKHMDDKHTMTFGDFAEYLIDNGNKLLDFHFLSASFMCKPCNFDYTYIVKAESIDYDEPWLLRRLNLTNLNVGRRGVPPGGSVVNGDIVTNIKKYIKELKPNMIKKLYNLYRVDFELFGYTFNFTTLEAGGFE